MYQKPEPVNVLIEDSDIATIEALHDLLVDKHGYSLDYITLKRARELTNKMYSAFKVNTRSPRDN